MNPLRSIRWRIQLWYGLMLVAVLAGLGLTAFTLQRSEVYRQIDNELMRRAQAVGAALRSRSTEGRGPRRNPGRPTEADPSRPGADQPAPAGARTTSAAFHLQPRDAELFEPADPGGYYFIAMTRDGREIARSANAPSDALDAMPASRPGGVQVPPVMRGEVREVHFETGQGEHVAVGRNIGAEMAELRTVALELTAVGGGILLFALAGGWWIATRSLRPIALISAAATKISSGDLSQRIELSEAESELGQLAAVLNSTFARLDTAFAQQKQFTSDVAHELRTPVSVLLTQTQMALSRERDAAAYRQTLEACQRAAQRMRRLIESLLELARFDAGQEILQRARLDLSGTTAECIELVRPLAEQRSIRLTSELSPVEVIGDAERLGQVLTNLLTNAIQFNRDGGEVHVTARREAGLAILSVRDTGVGLSAEDRSHVFERFYRVDRARTGPHAGLGLAICKSIVEAHGGTIEVDSEQGKGSAFTLRLPC